MPKKVCATVLKDEKLLSYVEDLNYLLRTYATKDIIAHPIKKLDSYRHEPGETSAVLYAKRLYTMALRCGIVYKEKGVKLLFVE